MVDTIKRGTIRYYLSRRAEIIDILARGGHEPDYVKMLEGARDMTTERIQQLMGIRLAQTAGVIVSQADDQALERLLRTVIGKHKE